MINIMKMSAYLGTYVVYVVFCIGSAPWPFSTRNGRGVVVNYVHMGRGLIGQLGVNCLICGFDWTLSLDEAEDCGRLCLPADITAPQLTNCC